MKRLTARVATIGVLGLVALAGTSSAAAATAPTPNGFCGAENMVVAWDTGMANAMSRNNPNGNIGMFHAVAVSGC